jgi:hypothetical protein
MKNIAKILSRWRIFGMLLSVQSIGLFIPVTTFAQSLDSTDYFPLQIGNEWSTIYYETMPMYFAGGWEVTGTETINDTTYFVPGYYRKDSVGNVYQRIDSADQLLYKTAGSIGDTWTLQRQDKYLVTLQTRSDNVETFAGVFANCERFFFKDLDAPTESDYVIWLAPAVGEILWSRGMWGYRELKRAEIGSVVISAPFHLVYQLPQPDQSSIDTSSGILFYLGTVIDTNVVLNSVTVTSRRHGAVAGVVHNFGNHLQSYTFTPSQKFALGDTITVKIAADILDIFGEGLDGNGDWRYEGSPTDDYTWRFFTTLVDGVRDNKPDVPKGFNVHQNYPNPFNGETILEYSLPARGMVIIQVYSILGRKIRTLFLQEQGQGTWRMIWNGKDNYGRSVSSGIYLIDVVWNNCSQIVYATYVK